MSSQRYRNWFVFGSLAVLGVAASWPLLVGGDQRSRLLALNSLLLAAGTCALALPWGAALAALLVRTDLPARKPALLVLGVMLFVPLYLQTAGWQVGFGLGGWCVGFHEAGAAEPLLSGWRGAIWIHAAAVLPWVVLIVGLGLATVPPQWEEMALIDASPWQVFYRVSLRPAWGAVGIAALWILVTTAGEITVTDVFQLRTYAEELYTGFALGEELYAAPLRVLPGMIIVAWLTVAAVVVCFFILPRRDLADTRPRRPFRLGPWRWPAALFSAGSVILVAGVPLGNLVYQAGVAVEELGVASDPTWSARHFLEIVGASLVEHAAEFQWTIVIGVLAAGAAVAIGILLAWPARTGGQRSVPLLIITACCLAIPGPLVGMALIEVLSLPGVPALTFLRDNTIFAPWAAQFVRCLPLATLVVWQALRTIPGETLEMAKVDGAGTWRRLFCIALPQCRGALVAAWLIACAIAMGDVAATAADMVIPPGIDLLSRRIAGMLHVSVYDEVAGICLTNAALFLLIAAPAIWLLSPRRPAPSQICKGLEQIEK